MVDKIKGALFGLSVGDALGVPVEFKSREQLIAAPVTTMKGFGSWNQPKGTWSDDSSLAFCLAESLSKGYDLNDIAGNFIKWRQQGFWGAHHKVFDIGGATRFAIDRLLLGISPLLSGGMMEEDNGNGSLMRILPLLFVIKELPVDERYKKIKEISSVTHAHFRSVFSCFIYMEIALGILNGLSAATAYSEMQKTVKAYVADNGFNRVEVKLFSRILESNISNCNGSSIHSSGYVLHTLEASCWCLLNTDNYSDAVLKAVNLGGDTDTTGCVTGGIAGLLYGFEAIPTVWIDELARKSDIENLCERLYKKISV